MLVGFCSDSSNGMQSSPPYLMTCIIQKIKRQRGHKLLQYENYSVCEELDGLQIVTVHFDLVSCEF